MTEYLRPISSLRARVSEERFRLPALSNPATPSAIMASNDVGGRGRHDRTSLDATGFTSARKRASAGCSSDLAKLYVSPDSSSVSMAAYVLRAKTLLSQHADHGIMMMMMMMMMMVRVMMMMMMMMMMMALSGRHDVKRFFGHACWRAS